MFGLGWASNGSLETAQEMINVDVRASRQARYIFHLTTREFKPLLKVGLISCLVSILNFKTCTLHFFTEVQPF